MPTFYNCVNTYMQKLYELSAQEEEIDKQSKEQLNQNLKKIKNC